MNDTNKFVETFYMWIPSASSLQHKECGQSPIFSHNGLQWRMTLYPRGCDADSRDYFSLFLELISPEDVVVQTKFAFFTRNAAGVYSHKMSTEYRFSANAQVAGCSKYLKRVSLVNGFTGIMCHIQATRVNDNCIQQMDLHHRAQAQVEVISPNQTDQARVRKVGETMLNGPVISNSTSTHCFDSCLNLSADLEVLLNNKEFSDVTLVTNNKQFHAHKAILAARSPVFFIIFTQSIYKVKNIIPIDDVADDVLAEVLRFIYTGQLSRVEDIAPELIAVSDRYQIDDLKKKCISLLGENLTIENAADILILSERQKATCLKSDVIKFINDNAAAVIKTDGYKRIVDSYLFLVEELYRSKYSQ